MTVFVKYSVPLNAAAHSFMLAILSSFRLWWRKRYYKLKEYQTVLDRTWYGRRRKCLRKRRGSKKSSAGLKKHFALAGLEQRKADSFLKSDLQSTFMRYRKPEQKVLFLSISHKYPLLAFYIIQRLCCVFLATNAHQKVVVLLSRHLI